MASQPKLLIRALAVVFLLYIYDYAIIHRHLASSILSQGQLRYYDYVVPPLDKRDVKANVIADHNSAKRWFDSDFRTLNVTEFPYKCGIVLFYHLPCTGQ